MTQTHLLKSRSLFDLYKEYPYRKNPITNSNTIPLPYIKKQDESKHQHALTFQQWKSIIEDLIEEITCQILMKGFAWHLGSNLGSITVKKIKVKTFTCRIESAKQKKAVVKLRNKHDNYFLLPEWERKNYPLNHKWLWRFSFTDKFLRRIYLKCESDYTYIFNFKDK